MIRVFEDWYITVDTNPVQYVVRKGAGDRDKRGWKDDPKGYVGSLGAALSFIRKQIHAERLSVGSRALPAALQIISEADDEFTRALKQAGLEEA